MSEPAPAIVPATPKPKFELQVKLTKSINFVNYQAEQASKRTSGTSRQNSFSFLKSVSIVNNTEEDCQDAILSVSFLPKDISCQDVNLACLEKEKTTVVDSFSTLIDPEYLYHISEAIEGSVVFTLKDKQGQILATATQGIHILPIEESASEDRVESILASFVTPNDDEVKELSSKAALELQNKYGRSSFAGYQYRDPNKVMEELDAIYLAILKEGIHYSNPPASFEKTFQRIRLPRTVLSEKVATCIDFSILFASVIENVGLNPMIVMIGGHAFIGCFLEEENFANAVEDNQTLVINDASKGFNKIVLINAVDCAAGNNINFAQSCENGYQCLAHADPFCYALDIVKCRMNDIRPVPTPHQVDGKTTIDFNLGDQGSYVNEKIDPNNRGSFTGKGNGKGKFDVWEAKLLDLNMRNQLINMRLSKSALQIVNTDSELLYQCLRDNEKLSILPIDSEPITNKKFVGFDFSKNSYGVILKDSVSHGYLHVLSGNGMPEKTLISLARKSNSEVEESGCNPLFLTIGSIEWYDNDKAAENKTGSVYSPLILIPAKLPRRRTGPYFTLELDFDGIQFNQTLFEFFRQDCNLDFSVFNGLFDSDDPVDLRKVFNTVRDKIASKKGWILHEEMSYLSLFSFAHFVMWSDMKNHHQEFMTNPVIASFVDGKREWKAPENKIALTDLDTKISPQDLAVPLPADSSQIEAIAASVNGESFVLDGPPGTGKSQTIANMIVNFMYHGKKVLFVAEKEVALQVVKKRLDDLKLGNFCLQIHSAKANKKDVLDQIKGALDVGQTKPATSFSEKAGEVKMERDDLNDIVNKLHKKTDYFLPIYDAILLYLDNKDYQGFLEIPDDYLSALTEEKHRECLKTIHDLDVYGAEVGDYHDNPLVYFQSREYDFLKRDHLLTELKDAKDRLTKDAKDMEEAFSSLFPGLPSNKENPETLATVLQTLEKDPAIQWNLLGSEAYQNSQGPILAYLHDCEDCLQKKEELKKTFADSVFELDSAYLKDLDSLRHFSNPFKKISSYFTMKKILKPCLLPNASFKKKDITPAIDSLVAYHLSLEGLAKTSPAVLMFHPEVTKGTCAACAQVQQKARNTFSLYAEAKKVAASSLPLSEILEEIQKIGEDPNLLYGNEISSFLSEEERIRSLLSHLKDTYGFDLYAGEDKDHYLSSACSEIDAAIASSGKLGSWTQYLQVLDKADQLLPLNLMDSYRKGIIVRKELNPSFECAVGYTIAANGLAKEKLTTLSSVTTDETIHLYKKMMDDFATLMIQETAAKVTSKYPVNTMAYASSTVPYAVQKIVSSSGRGLSLRAFFTQYGSFLQDLCPCFLMSPLSVSQYLSADPGLFDVVIFDEASQIPTSEAIGSIARAKSVIVAGDQNQMPPTDFFASSLGADDEDDSDVIYEDLESLLEDVISLGLPRRRLNWHYRSHDESLIAFSNNRFYDNSLYTFPSPSSQVSKVRFQYVGGHYERGKGINREEAQAIVDEVLRRIKDPEDGKKSIGIITFNEKQQNLISDLLDKQFAADPNLNQNPGGEEIFVKNLENVQGDERDVILFSICFGPDSKGNMVLNFGPLSREKGERRLNVAVSRARDEMIVYSSVQPEMIRASQAKNEGASYLQNFLSYAKNGITSLTNLATDKVYVAKESIASFIAKDLRALGYSVDTDVGSSCFRIDMAVKDPSNPENYLLGILCDSSVYCSSATCQDRNVVQPTILARLHWNLLRVWSVEYLDHPEEVIARIQKTLQDLSSGKAVKPLPFAPTAKPDAPDFEKKKDPVSYPHRKHYEEGNYEEYTNEDPVLRIVRTEGPISKKILYDRYRSCMGIARIGNRIAETIESSIIENGIVIEYCDDMAFFWLSRSDKDSFSVFRTGGDRDILDIPYEEIVNAMIDILALQGSMSEEDLLKQTSLIFNYQSLKDKAHTYLMKALQDGIRRQKIKEEQGVVSVFVNPV
jgi:hypothetical protein